MTFFPSMRCGCWRPRNFLPCTTSVQAVQYTDGSPKFCSLVVIDGLLEVEYRSGVEYLERGVPFRSRRLRRTPAGRRRPHPRHGAVGGRAMVRSTYREHVSSLAASIWGGMFVMVRVATPVIPPVPARMAGSVDGGLRHLRLRRLAKGSWRVSPKDWRLFSHRTLGQTRLHRRKSRYHDVAPNGLHHHGGDARLHGHFARLLLRGP